MAAVLVVFILFMASIVVLLVGLLPLLSGQIGDLIQKLPSMIEKSQSVIMDLPERYPDFISKEDLNGYEALLKEPSWQTVTTPCTAHRRPQAA